MLPRTKTTASLTVLVLTLPTSANSIILDAASPSTLGQARIMQDNPGPAIGPPGIGITRARLGLVAGDRIDALSAGNDDIEVSMHGPHRKLFSVTRLSAGLAGSAVEAERLGDTAPGVSPGQAADIFAWSPMALGTNVLAPAGRGYRAGSRDGDEANTALTNGGARDELAGLERATLIWAGGGAPPFEVYFSLAPGSPTLGLIGANPADILAVGGAFGAAPVVFIPAPALGIPAGAAADVDALSLEVTLGPAGPTPVAIHFSVTAATATGWAFFGNPVNSGADVLVRNAGPGGAVIRPGNLGLMNADDIDALEAVLVAAPCPADINLDGIVNVGDVLIVFQSWGDDGGGPADVDGDGVVGIGDLLVVFNHWGPCE